jgi:phosphate transport system substrate-binding protein
MIGRRLALLSAAAMACALAVAACGDTPGELQGAVHIEAPGALVPLSQAVAEGFERQNPGVEISVREVSDEQALESLCTGKADIAGASRRIRPTEAEACEQQGVSYEEAAVANEAIVVLLNRSNPERCLRVEHLQAIWRPKKPVERWPELANKGNTFKERIERFGPDPSSAPFAFFTEVINGVEGRQTRAFTRAGEEERRTVDRVAQSKGAVGYLGFPSFQIGMRGVRAAEIESEQTGICVLPTLVAVQDGSYSPLSRELLIYTSSESIDEPASKAFVDYYIQRASEVAESIGLVPLSETQLEESKKGVG